MVGILFSLLIIFGAGDFVDGQTLTQSKTLMSDMLNGYDKRHRPILNQSQPIHVNVSFDIVAIQDFDEVEEKFSVVGVLYLSWMDESIVWNPYSYGGIWSQMYRIEDVWYPILILANPYNAVKDIGDDWMTVRILFNGMSFFSPGAVFKSTCSVDVTYYPFDTQKCELLFIPWGFSNTEMKLVSVRSDVMQSFYSKNGEWVLESTEAIHTSDGTFDSITFTFNIKRKPLFLVVNVILPIVFMAVINILVFVLPVESGERVSYATTVLLAIAVFLTLVGDNLPKTSEPMSVLCYFLMIILVISTLMCVITIFNMNVYHKKSKHVPEWIAYLTLFVKCKQSPTCKRQKRVEDVGTHARTGVNIIRMDKEPSKQTARIIAFAEEMEDATQEVTWKDVSAALDRVSVIVFTVTLGLTVGIYLDILANNKRHG